MNNTSPILNRKIDNPWIKAGLLIAFYFVFGMGYWVTILVTSGGKSDFFVQMLMDYFMKGLLTLPVWWLVFKVLKDWSLWKRILVHLVIMPIWVVGWQQLYYFVCDSIDFWHLGSKGSAWDIYIPALFYVLQFGIYHLYEFDKKYRDEQRTAAELRELALQSELSALKAQLNPHFLYNTFNAISASVPPEQEKTREMIAKLADLFRYQLKASREDLVPLNEELTFVRKYLELEKARFAERLHFEIEVTPELEEIPVPPMLLQPLVENSIKHGLSSKIEGGEIKVKVVQSSQEIQFEISDTGVGMNTEDPAHLKGGVGLTNTVERLKKMYNRDLRISSNSPTGTVIKFSIPLETDSLKYYPENKQV